MTIVGSLIGKMRGYTGPVMLVRIQPNYFMGLTRFRLGGDGIFDRVGSARTTLTN